jgi:hypothetical protein
VSKINNSPVNVPTTTISPKAGKLLDAVVAPPKAAKLLGLEPNTVISHRATAQTPPHSSGVGEKIKAFVSEVGKEIAGLANAGLHALKGLVSRAPQANPPAAQQSQTNVSDASTKPAKPQPHSDPQIIALRKTGIYKTFNNGIDVSKMTPAERGACSYANVRFKASEAKAGASEETKSRCVNTFLRSDNSASKVSAFIAKQSPEVQQTTTNIAKILKDKTVGISAAAYGVDGKPAQHNGIGSALKDGKSLTDLAKASIATMDDALIAFIGDPSDLDSIEAAANRLDQNLCNQLGTNWKAIEDSGVTDPDTSHNLKMQCGRDALGLRTQMPALTNLSVLDTTLTQDQKRTIQENNKGMISVVNGFRIGSEGKDASPEVAEAAAHLNDRWDPALEKFFAFAAARADPAAVSQAALEGAPMLAEYQALEQKIADRTAELNAA